MIEVKGYLIMSGKWLRDPTMSAYYQKACHVKELKTKRCREVQHIDPKMSLTQQLGTNLMSLLDLLHCLKQVTQPHPRVSRYTTLFPGRGESEILVNIST